MAIVNIPPDVYAHDMYKKKYGVSKYEVDNQLGDANPMKVVADAIKDVAKTNPNINITVNINTKGNEETSKTPMIEIKTVD